MGRCRAPLSILHNDRWITWMRHINWHDECDQDTDLKALLVVNCEDPFYIHIFFFFNGSWVCVVKLICLISLATLIVCGNGIIVVLKKIVLSLGIGYADLNLFFLFCNSLHYVITLYKDLLLSCFSMAVCTVCVIVLLSTVCDCPCLCVSSRAPGPPGPDLCLR